MIPRGFSFSAINSGVKSINSKGLDMGLVLCETDAPTTGVFTTNKIKAAPVMIGMDILKDNTARAIITNSGNANACTGDQGIEDALSVMDSLAGSLGVERDKIIPMSTGVIGIRLPVERMTNKMPELVKGLGNDIDAFSRSLMTTDTYPKVAHRKAGRATVLGFAKGAGMIAPDMATTLAIILTDADIDPITLNNIIKDAVNTTFNAITIDGDTSTNDTLIAMTSGLVHEDDMSAVAQALQEVIEDLALMIVRDGEGATKVISVDISGSCNNTDAKRIAMSICNSLLVKTAMFGADPNWGRIMAAIGYSGIDINPNEISIKIQGIDVASAGKQADLFDEDALHNALLSRNIDISINMGDGPGAFKAWTTDLSYKYVEINAEYRT